jgi:hypothetical protein
MTDTTQTKPLALKPELLPLKALCNELSIDPRLAREKLRIAVRDPKKFPELAKAHKPRTSWEWPKGSSLEKEARAVLLS